MSGRSAAGVSLRSGDDLAGVVGCGVGAVPAGVQASGHVRGVHRAGDRAGRRDRAALGGWDAGRGADGPADLLPCRVSVLLLGGVGHRPAGLDRGPADRDAAARAGRADHGGDRRHPVQALGPPGLARVLDPRRRRPGR